MLATHDRRGAGADHAFVVGGAVGVAPLEIAGRAGVDPDVVAGIDGAAVARDGAESRNHDLDIAAGDFAVVVGQATDGLAGVIQGREAAPVMGLEGATGGGGLKTGGRGDVVLIDLSAVLDITTSDATLLAPNPHRLPQGGSAIAAGSSYERVLERGGAGG